MKTIGEVAYETWRAYHKNMRLQSWDKLQPAIRSVWEGIARAVVEEHLKNSMGKK